MDYNPAGAGGGSTGWLGIYTAPRGLKLLTGSPRPRNPNMLSTQKRIPVFGG